MPKRLWSWLILKPAPLPRREILIETFKLTPVEARLANRLALGEPIEIIAENLGIAYETARNVLKKHLSQDRDATPR